uniref:5'-nucleotidase domain containing 3 n=1 Tax=Eptatretus burgeri TaxID=7764 RepID=A0A8C4NGV6_EPTBU
MLVAETWTIGKFLPISPSAVFANNEVHLGDVAVYGFDYDYTLALYSPELHAVIYSSAMDVLLEKYKVGGLSLVPHDEVQGMYEGTHVPLEQMSDFYGKGSVMKQFMDIFSLPEMTLLSSVNDYFIRHNIDYDPVHLYKDVSDAVRDVHVKGLIYDIIAKDMVKYQLLAVSNILTLIYILHVTNFMFCCRDKGMHHMVGPDWQDLFDVIIVKADKPGFFHDRRRPFRRLADQGGMLWDRITSLRKGEVYKQGNLYEFLRLTGWTGSSVLYFGDHIYSDLADLTLRHGWRTGAVIPELGDEIKTMNSASFVSTLAWLQTLTALLETSQVLQDAESVGVLKEWQQERHELRLAAKSQFNPFFGSLFRTAQNPTYFSRRLARFADIYTASVSCLLGYSLQHIFYPRRTPLQHEGIPPSPDPSWFKSSD